MEIADVSAVIKAIPVNRIFLETDSSNLSIEKIYELAGSSLNLSIEKLQSIVIENAKYVFGSLIAELYE